jgi:RimJ/RimL family protein N-acetyltransferase
MENNQNLQVRELESRDIDLLADYWLLSDPHFLEGMGVDLSKIPSRQDLHRMLTAQLDHSVEKKQSYALIWELNAKQIGHSNVNQIEFGTHAYMHLHLWNSTKRQNGLGAILIRKSLPYFFENLQLKTLYCEPYALNSAPNKILPKMGFEFVKTHVTIPGSLNFEQQVNLWKLTRENYLKKFNP